MGEGSWNKHSELETSYRDRGQVEFFDVEYMLHNSVQYVQCTYIESVNYIKDFKNLVLTLVETLIYLSKHKTAYTPTLQETSYRN